MVAHLTIGVRVTRVVTGILGTALQDNYYAAQCTVPTTQHKLAELTLSGLGLACKLYGPHFDELSVS